MPGARPRAVAPVDAKEDHEDDHRCGRSPVHVGRHGVSHGSANRRSASGRSASGRSGRAWSRNVGRASPDVRHASPDVGGDRPAGCLRRDGWRHGQARIRQIYVTCDASVIVTVAGWKYWTAVSARSQGGKLLVNTCQPGCAAGHYRKYASTLIFYRARSRHGVRYFTRMRLRYRHGGFRSYVYRWGRCPGGTRPVWVGGP
jgi:hypothetical protein